MTAPQPPLAIRHSTGAEWLRHIAGRALADRSAQAARAEQAAAWRLIEAFLPCG
jgi:hypothetical protein